MIERGEGNLLEADVDALVNTVNTEGVMGKGLALQFKRAFPENFRAYERACRKDEIRVGRMFVTERLASPKYIINFPTKKHWRQPSKLEYVREGLDDLVREVRERSIRSIAVPPLGCGHGGLHWSDVRPMITEAFRSMPEVRVVLHEPDGAPAPEEMVDRTDRPRMTPGRAALLALMEDYRATGYDYRLTLLEIQKLAYFMQAQGEPLELEFKAHYYGPYADTLRKVLRHIEGHFTRGIGDGRASPHTPIELLPGATDEARDLLGERPETQARLERVRSLIEGFETPFGMELLATTHWVMQQDRAAYDEVQRAIEAVSSWNASKKSVMKPPQIRAAWSRLREHDRALATTMDVPVS